MLKQRLITAVILVAALLLALFYLDQAALSGLFAVLVLAACWEWAKLAGLDALPLRAMYTAVCAGLIYGVACFAGLSDAPGVDGPLRLDAVRDVLGLACLWWAVALLWVKGYPSSAVFWGGRLPRAVIGTLCLVPAWLALVYLYIADNSPRFILVAIVLVVASDVGGYFFGRAFGKAKLAPAVSPGKSWAGFWGGVALNLAVAAGIFYAGQAASLSLQQLLVLALFTGLASVLGDLLESMVKRHRGIKDSGRILPGHGGIMDRLDSLTAALPVFALGLLLIA